MPFKTGLNGGGGGGGGTKRDDDFGLRSGLSIYRNPAVVAAAAPSIPVASDARYNGTVPGRVFVRVNLTNLISPPSGTHRSSFSRFRAQNIVPGQQTIIALDYGAIFAPLEPNEKTPFFRHLPPQTYGRFSPRQAPPLIFRSPLCKFSSVSLLPHGLVIFFYHA